MREFLLWWVGIEAVGLAAFPLTYAFFRRLPDRGFAFSKVIGLLLLGYGVWMGAVIGLFPNSRGSVFLVLFLIVGLSALIAWRHRQELPGFLRSAWRYIAFVEVLFFAVLAAAIFIRSFAPAIEWGEKPFELAFLNSISRSESFPPRDPWLAGHSISYYYFGYVMIAALTKLVALGTNVTFYLGLSLMAALASVTAFGLVYNMIVASRRRTAPALPEGSALVPRAAVFGLAAAVLMVIVSNLAGVFELMARHGIGSRGFYGLVGIFRLNGTYNCAAAPLDCSDWYPTRYWWWWKATRMGSPYDIQEFPFFSFQFGDLHPHVLVMPFLITLFAVAFQIVLSARSDQPTQHDRARPAFLQSPDFTWRSLVLALLVGGAVLIVALALRVTPILAVQLAGLVAGVQLALGIAAEASRGDGEEGERLDALWWIRQPGRFLLVALLLGGMVFIDAWTLPVATLMVIAAVGVANWLRTGGRPLRVLADSVGFALPVVAAMFLFYLPFHVNLDADIRGLDITQTAMTADYPPAASESTRPLHFLLFWAPLLWIGLSFVAVYIWGRWREVLTRPALLMAAFAWAAPIGLWALIVLGRDGFSGLADELSERGPSLITILILMASITAVALAFLHQLRRPTREQDRSELFVFCLAGFAFLMMLGAEFYFVNDLLGWRANTVFRFWHQSWIILAIVGGFGFYRLTLGWRLPQVRLGRGIWPSLALGGVAFGAIYSLLVAIEPWDVLYAKWWTATLGIFVAGVSIVAYAVAAAVRNAPRPVVWRRLAWLAVTTVILAAALVYPVTVTFERTGGFRNPQSLNGLVHVQRDDPAEYEAIQWLNRNVEGTPVILEGVGNDFSDFARVSSRTGLPTVIGWVGHEIQWRGYPDTDTGDSETGTPFTARPDDVKLIYSTTDAGRARSLLEQYEVEYVYIGRLERQKYGEKGLAKFREFMLPVFDNGGVTIYRMPGRARLG